MLYLTERVFWRIINIVAQFLDWFSRLESECVYVIEMIQYSDFREWNLKMQFLSNMDNNLTAETFKNQNITSVRFPYMEIWDL